MTQLEYKQAVYDILQDLKGIEPLKELFWGELNYDRVNEPLSRQGWSKAANEALAEDKKVRDIFPCPHCASSLTKRRLLKVLDAQFFLHFPLSLSQWISYTP